MKLRQVYILPLSFLFAISCGTTKDIHEVKEVDDKEQGIDSLQQLKDENTFLLTEISDDETYGYTPENPILVGGVQQMQGPLNQRRYLNALASPTGREIDYYHKESCCPFQTEKGMIKSTGMLDIYVVSWKGNDEPIELYLNMYDSGYLKAPKGFTIAD